MEVEWKAMSNATAPNKKPGLSPSAKAAKLKEAGYSEETMAEINKDGCLNVSETSRSKEELPKSNFL